MEGNIKNTLISEFMPGKNRESTDGYCIGMVLPELKSEPARCPTVATLIHVGPDDRLRFSFLKSSLSAQAAKKHFCGPSFYIEVPVELPADIQAHFRYQRKQIRAGNYPISQNEHFFIVTC